MSYQARVLKVSACADNLWELHCQAHSEFSFEPAQVISVMTLVGEVYFALSSSPAEAPYFSLLIRSPDHASLPFAAGDEFTFEGPWGKGFSFPNHGQVWLIGAGSAMGAIRSAWRAALQRPEGARALHVIAAVRRAEELCFYEELWGLKKEGAQVSIVLSQQHLDENHFKGHIQDHLQTWVSLGMPSRVCLVGSESFEDDIRDALLSCGVPYDAVQLNYRLDGRDKLLSS